MIIKNRKCLMKGTDHTLPGILLIMFSVFIFYYWEFHIYRWWNKNISIPFPTCSLFFAPSSNPSHSLCLFIFYKPLSQLVLPTSAWLWGLSLDYGYATKYPHLHNSVIPPCSDTIISNRSWKGGRPEDYLLRLLSWNFGWLNIVQILCR